MIRAALFVSALTALTAWALHAQANVPQMRGDVGLKAGTQMPAGLFIGGIYNNYETHDVVTKDGAEISLIRPIVNSTALLGIYSSDVKVLGGRWSAIVALPWVNIGLATPNLDTRSSWGFSDMYVVPLQLGWTFPMADLLVGQGAFIPTGRFHNGALDNTGFGMWSWESTLGGTVYLNSSKQLNISTLASYQVQGKVRGTDKRAGNVLVLEGGVGHAIAEGYGQLGVAYYTRWKLTADENYRLPAPFDGKDRTFGIGPEITTPVLAHPFVTFVTLRYYVEGGNRVATQGSSFWLLANAYFPMAAAK
jgi:hypothetical protein